MRRLSKKELVDLPVGTIVRDSTTWPEAKNRLWTKDENNQWFCTNAALRVSSLHLYILSGLTVIDPLEALALLVPDDHRMKPDSKESK